MNTQALVDPTTVMPTHSMPLVPTWNRAARRALARANGLFKKRGRRW